MHAGRRTVAKFDWDALSAELDERGFVQTPKIYTAGECRELEALFDDDGRFRSTVDMRRHRFGEGEYRYFDAPLPAPINQVRRALYPSLAELANVGPSVSASPCASPTTSTRSCRVVTKRARNARRR